ncbi:hypothetical protein DL96DRAFT_1529754 [Flagelloscypha sp. PMI_526]|nr:hypothetical protein DL96DRAFT_1529754 [Flagelloscypha sp. PMI_526]
MLFGRSSYAFYLYSLVQNHALLWIERLFPTQRPEWKDLTGKTAIVTGANVGIGLEIARGLALRGAIVILACRNREKAEAAKKNIVGSANGKVQDTQLEIMQVDISDLRSVRAFVREWGTRPLDILMNNAGITSETYRKSPQGFELDYATNILSHYLLTLLLLPHIRPNGRIISTCSGANYNPSSLDPLDLGFTKQLEGQGLKEGDVFTSFGLMMTVYGRTKCMQVLFTRELQHRLEQSEVYKAKNITVHCYHPGTVHSDIFYRENSTIVSKRTRNFVLVLVNIFTLPTTEGAATGIHLAVSDAAAKNPGLYWYRMSVSGPNRLVEAVQNRKLVFDQLAVDAGLEENFRV